jgi:exosome complex component RRP42
VDQSNTNTKLASSPAAYPHLQPSAVDDLSYDLSNILHQTLSHPSLHPKNLSILKDRKAWICYLDIVVLNDSGNIYDVLFISARAALWDTKVPRTRGVEYVAKSKGRGKTEGGGGDMEKDEEMRSGFETRRMHMESSADFELLDYWDEGGVLAGQEAWPVCVTLNLVRSSLRSVLNDDLRNLLRSHPCTI